MSTITPESIPGFHAVGRTTGTTEDLKGLSFATTCPPDIGPRTRLIAVCGITDDEDDASPAKDGWFLSDFYLFHYLFSDLHGPTASQIWMTSEKPEDLVRKYKEYVHGDPRGERRVVLDKSMLPGIEQSGSLRVVSRKDLLERFLCTLREQSLLAKTNDQHLVVMVFGHGDERTYGVALGGYKPNLHIENVKRALQPDTSVTLFMTSCYSGGWIVQPNTMRSRYINATGITGAGPKAESKSWPESSSLRRACGSIIASAILQTSIAIEESQETVAVHTDPTYYSFAQSVYDSYKRLDPLADTHKIHFSAQDDQWALHFKCRSGMPLSQLKLRWESLRSVPLGDYHSEGSDGHGTGTSRYGTARKLSKVKYAALYYFHCANPGPHNNASNIGLHGQLMALLSGREKFSDEELDEMFETLRYRLDALAQADELAMVMGVANETFNAYSYVHETWKQSPEEDKLDFFAWRLLVEKELVDRPIEGHFWPKPVKFLCACLVMSGLDYDEIEQRIEIAESYKRTQAEAISELYGSQIMRDEEVIRGREKLLNKMTSLGRKVRAVFRH
ncbi:hypothetical protein BDV35DRAFT_382091 [Aspergillus flavus]|uniref:Unnamed protein product n=5 Tax=Aspergillus subgen. Circumdati TaxID=2720871 RepID=A0A1S9E0B5_ASPOZ|nr:unnamed protein product [Aspergillus oryzae RIB40]EIT78055.1 hypothetical protein Ao3042_05644 [Aspergillus oryzae 3.042]KAB8244681.1 hypothetical protein BDV35DRAFT_382091 [Aspergillus flavus]KDE79534.1 hypothetical protein AO1008_05943 [Aspergillus oryzae 100-8]OOO14749.1 hypothetical protein OAory_01033440 [Aspergillus oryzae]GMG45149.1 unnamed protein product [Aspergillus oryzae var. brunneus]|eukprot:EIT78055.1 hypothetical protein Ao3042_05644 [Aspergillus oryzae 3.042]